MTVAAQQAQLLQTSMANAAHQADGLRAAQDAFMAGIESIIGTPWTMTRNSDLAFPQTRGERPHDFAQTQRGQDTLVRAAINDQVIHRLLVEVTHLLKPLSSLGTPAMRERIEAASRWAA
jgi:hypothetical protein